MKESPLDLLKLDVCLAAEQWFMHRTKRGIPHTKSIEEAEAALEKIAGKWLDTKIEMVKAAIEKSRAESPDGKTSWDRVEEHRLKFGHLPQGEKTCDICAKERP